ncbi:hypothetical protein SV7mr_26750 [Stieleria bergensis]|uniref:Uncharacterized protein n=1 Tax=Stieleria bergensis TaxID=2528025 RepID=A0A517SVL3_9BACT|nr:hypothetical protein SV7mr_26750 [Planctomycetes bacterium SV_7m_r]
MVMLSAKGLVTGQERFLCDIMRCDPCSEEGSMNHQATCLLRSEQGCCGPEKAQVGTAKTARKTVGEGASRIQTGNPTRQFKRANRRNQRHHQQRCNATQSNKPTAKTTAIKFNAEDCRVRRLDRPLRRTVLSTPVHPFVLSHCSGFRPNSRKTAHVSLDICRM